MFDGNLTNLFTTLSGTSSVFTPETPVGSTSLEFFGNYGGDGTITFNWDGGSYTFSGAVANTWIDVTSNVQFPITSIEMAPGTTGVALGAFKANGNVLVNTDLSLNLRVNQVLENNLIGVPSTNINFTPGKYLYIPVQRIAPWVLRETPWVLPETPAGTQ